MADIYINESIRLSRLGLQVKDFTNHWVKLHCQQGRLDGACAVYSVVMALLSIGYISGSDIEIYKNPNPDKRTAKGKLLSTLLDEKGLVRSGYYFRTMAQLLREYCAADLNVNHHTKEEIFLPLIQSNLDNKMPTVISVQNNEMCHAIYIVGYEYNYIDDNNLDVLKLFCLDPGFGIDSTAYWNCIIDVSQKMKGDFPYWYITSGIVSKVKILDILTIKKKV